jgi:hypothetical protein
MTGRIDETMPHRTGLITRVHSKEILIERSKIEIWRSRVIGKAKNPGIRGKIAKIAEIRRTNLVHATCCYGWEAARAFSSVPS